MIDWQQADLLDGARRSRFGPHLHDAAPLAGGALQAARCWVSKQTCQLAIPSLSNVSVGRIYSQVRLYCQGPSVQKNGQKQLASKR